MRMRSLRGTMVFVAFVAVFLTIAARTREAMHRQRQRAFIARLERCGCVFSGGPGKPIEIKVSRQERDRRGDPW